MNNLPLLTAVYIEDNFEIRQIVQDYLDKIYGIGVIGAQTAANGLELVERLQPNLVLLDQMLPDINGLEVCRLIRANSSTRHIPIIMLSVDDTPLTIEAAYAAGANGYVFKPIDFETLRVQIEHLFQDGQVAARLPLHSTGSLKTPIGTWHQQRPEAILADLAMNPRSAWPHILVNILSDINSEMRGAAVVAAAAWQKEYDAPFNKTPGQRFFWEYVRHSLVSSTPEDAENRWRELAWVAYGLMSPPDRINARLVKLCRENRNAECRQWALRILIENNLPGAPELAAEKLGDHNDEVRATAALTLAALGSVHHIPLLTQTLSDPSAGVREQAATALAKIGGDMSLIALETALLQGIPEAAQAAAKALALMASADAVDALVQAAGERPEPAVLCQVAHALGSIKNNKCRLALWKLSKHDDDQVRKIAAAYVEIKGTG